MRHSIEATLMSPTPPSERDAERWSAVVARDTAADGQFVYGTASTGIYCRPSCPSRRPRPDRVRFFRSPALARSAGFRACRRCRPDGDDPVRRTIRDLCSYIDAHPEGVPTLAKLSERAGLSPYHLQRTFKRLVGVTPRQYADARRSERVRERLARGDDVLAAGFGAGYGSASRLYASAPRELGMTPGRFRRGGAGERVRYAIVPSPLGRLLVAATARGVCRVSLGRTVAELRERLRHELPHAELVRDEEGLRTWVAPVVEWLGGGPAIPDLPLDVQATAFQRRVWEALRAIPEGDTQSYEEVARRIGEPSAVRAVAGACARNPVPLVVPCHRVVRKDGSPGGYALGEKRKRRLLEIESREKR